MDPAPPAPPTKRHWLLPCLIAGMVGLFVSGYLLTDWQCRGCADSHVPLVFVGAGILGLCAFVGSIVWWHDLSPGVRLTGVLLPLALGLLGYATAIVHLARF